MRYRWVGSPGPKVLDEALAGLVVLLGLAVFFLLLAFGFRAAAPVAGESEGIAIFGAGILVTALYLPRAAGALS